MLLAGPIESDRDLVVAKDAHAPDMCIGDLTLHGRDRLVCVGGAPVSLTNAEFNMLEILLRNRGNIVTKARLTEAGMSRPLEKHDRSVDMLISNLRKKIGPTADGNRRIGTARGVGYFFKG